MYENDDISSINFEHQHPFHMVFFIVASAVLASTLYSFIQLTSSSLTADDRMNTNRSHIDTSSLQPIHMVSHFTAIGRRNHQEDRALICNFGNENRYFLAVVCDGHASDVCSSFLIHHIEERMLARLTQPNLSKSQVTTGDRIQAACMDLHELWNSTDQTRLLQSGSTLTGILLDRQDPLSVWTFNLGDSKCVLLLDGGQQLLETNNHDLSSTRVEQVRQQDPSAMIEYDDEGTLRVMGIYASINMSGSFGNTYDPRLSKSLLRDVEIQKWQLGESRNARIIIGSDGIFDDFDAVQVAKIIRQHERTNETKMDAKSLVDYVLLHGTKGDNTTAIILEISS